MIPNQVIYTGRIMHMRLIPKKNKFQYKFFSLFLNIDCLDETFRKFKLLNLNRFGLLSFYEKDHGLRDGSLLRTWVDRQLKMNSMPAADNIFLLSFPRMLGYVFNPFSAYFCYSKGTLSSIIYEVKNTFGDQIVYVSNGLEEEPNIIRHNHIKEMYVSPFIEMNQTYRFSIKPPKDRLSIRIKQSGLEGETLIATQNGKAIELNDANLLKCMLTHPLMTLKVIIGIHWEAFRLALMGIKYQRYTNQFRPDNKILKK
jgi:DUF1365 family protein